MNGQRRGSGTAVRMVVQFAPFQPMLLGQTIPFFSVVNSSFVISHQLQPSTQQKRWRRQSLSRQRLGVVAATPSRNCYQVVSCMTIATNLSGSKRCAQMYVHSFKAVGPNVSGSPAGIRQCVVVCECISSASARFFKNIM